MNKSLRFYNEWRKSDIYCFVFRYYIMIQWVFILLALMQVCFNLYNVFSGKLYYMSQDKIRIVIILTLFCAFLSIFWYFALRLKNRKFEKRYLIEILENGEIFIDGEKHHTNQFVISNQFLIFVSNNNNNNKTLYVIRLPDMIKREVILYLSENIGVAVHVRKTPFSCIFYKLFKKCILI